MQRSWELFHILWTKAVGTPSYNKREWQELEPFIKRRNEQGDAPKILDRGDRGFHGYGAPFRDSYGGELEVYESSAAENPHVWLAIRDRLGEREAARTANAHMNEAQARALIARLQLWLDEVPERWPAR